MYEVRFYRDLDMYGRQQYVLIATCVTLKAATRARRVNGDLIVHANTEKVVESDEWLVFGEHDSYARSRLGEHKPGERLI